MSFFIKLKLLSHIANKSITCKIKILKTKIPENFPPGNPKVFFFDKFLLFEFEKLLARFSFENQEVVF
jgi:hypothetical protein